MMGKCPRGWTVCTQILERKSISTEQLVSAMNERVDAAFLKIDPLIRGGASDLFSNGLDPGDLVEVTIGHEEFTPGIGGSFTVGPITVKTVVRPGDASLGKKRETAQEAYTRARSEASIMFEAEYQIKRKEFFDRVKEVNSLCQDVSQS